MSAPIRVKKINNAQVVPIKSTKRKEDTRPVLGSDLFPALCANIFICARKNSGKTVCIAKIIDECADRDTKIVVFSATIHSDKTWIDIQARCKKKRMNFDGSDSIYDEDGTDRMKAWLTVMQREQERKHAAEQEDDDENFNEHVNFHEEPEDEDEKKKPYQAPEFLFIFDDLSDEIRKNNTLIKFLKIQRHFKNKVIISSQYPKDMKPESLRQINYWIMFKGWDDKLLEWAYKASTVSCDFSAFKRYYNVAVAKPFSFLYIDVNRDEFRITFSDLIVRTDQHAPASQRQQLPTSRQPRSSNRRLSRESDASESDEAL